MGICCKFKACLFDYVWEIMQEDLICWGENLCSIFELINVIKDNVLVIGFVCWFVIYKWAYLLFINLE